MKVQLSVIWMSAAARLIAIAADHLRCLEKWLSKVDPAYVDAITSAWPRNHQNTDEGKGAWTAWAKLNRDLSDPNVTVTASNNVELIRTSTVRHTSDSSVSHRLSPS
jgi:hypothetical protein